MSIPLALQVAWHQTERTTTWPFNVPAGSWIGRLGPNNKVVAVLASGEHRRPPNDRWYYWHAASGAWEWYADFADLEQAKACVQRDAAALA